MAGFDGVALGGQCYRQLDGNSERLGVADMMDEMASWLTMALIHQDGMGGYVRGCGQLGDIPAVRMRLLSGTAQ